MAESFPSTLDDQSEVIHSLTEDYMEALASDRLNPLFVGEDLAGQVATGEITEDVAEEVIENLCIDQVTDD